MSPPVRPANARILDRLAAMVHTPDDTSFLRACLADDEEARRSWIAWIGRGNEWLDSSAHLGRRSRAFAPLILAALERHGIEIRPQALATLRAWRLQERLRAERYEAILHRVLTTLSVELPRVVIVKGTALAHTVYPDPVLRHCHDIDVLLPEADLARGTAALLADGFRKRCESSPGHVTLVDRSGLPVLLHASPFLLPYYVMSFDSAAAVCETRTIAGVPVSVLNPAHALVQVCVQGLTTRRGVAGLRWVVDAWQILAGHPPVAWNRVVACARDAGFALPLAVGLTYLARHVHARIPPDCSQALLRMSSGRLSAEQWRLIPLLPAAPRRCAALRCLPMGWRSRGLVAMAILFPPVGIARAWGARPGLGLPVWYGRRLLRQVRRRSLLPNEVAAGQGELTRSAGPSRPAVRTD